MRQGRRYKCQKENVKRKIVGIPDGDTVRTRTKVQGSNYLRLRGFNTPERNQKGFQTAKRRLTRALPANKTVGVTVVARDKYGRPVVELRNGRKSINKKMRGYGY